MNLAADRVAAKYGRKASFRYSTTTPGTLTLKIRRGGKVVAKVTKRVSAAGRGTVIWSGRAGNSASAIPGRRLARGRYTTTLTLTPAGGKAHSDSARLSSLIHDRRRVGNPGSGSSDRDPAPSGVLLDPRPELLGRFGAGSGAVGESASTRSEVTTRICSGFAAATGRTISSSPEFRPGFGAPVTSIRVERSRAGGRRSKTTVTSSPLGGHPALQQVHQPGHRALAVAPPAVGAGADHVHAVDEVTNHQAQPCTMGRVTALGDGSRRKNPRPRVGWILHELRGGVVATGGKTKRLVCRRCRLPACRACAAPAPAQADSFMYGAGYDVVDSGDIYRIASCQFGRGGVAAGQVNGPAGMATWATRCSWPNW